MSRSRRPKLGSPESQQSPEQQRTRDEHVEAALKVAEPTVALMGGGLLGTPGGPGLHKTRTGDARVQLLLATVAEVAETRMVLLHELRAACLADRVDEVVRVARLLVGLDGA